MVVLISRVYHKVTGTVQSANHHRNTVCNENHFYGIALVYLTSYQALKQENTHRQPDIEFKKRIAKT